MSTPRLMQTLLANEQWSQICSSSSPRWSLGNARYTAELFELCFVPNCLLPSAGKLLSCHSSTYILKLSFCYCTYKLDHDSNFADESHSYESLFIKLFETVLKLCFVQQCFMRYLFKTFDFNIPVSAALVRNFM